jgi:hypothetical protein
MSIAPPARRNVVTAMLQKKNLKFHHSQSGEKHGN